MELAQSLFRRFWILALIQGVERAGCSPIELKRLHSLAYMANALAPCYGVESLQYTVLKEDKGPLFPPLVWDTDRLVGMGLLTVSHLVIGTESGVRNASYSISQRGLKLVSTCLLDSEGFLPLAHALWSIALAYTRNPLALAELSLLRRDGNYANPHFGLGDIVDFGQWDTLNATANAVQTILTESTEKTLRHPSVGINLYAQYLSDGGASDG